jgi:hypothetical protein
MTTLFLTLIFLIPTIFIWREIWRRRQSVTFEGVNHEELLNTVKLAYQDSPSRPRFYCISVVKSTESEDKLEEPSSNPPKQGQVKKQFDPEQQGYGQNLEDPCDSKIAKRISENENSFYGQLKVPKSLYAGESYNIEASVIKQIQDYVHVPNKENILLSKSFALSKQEIENSSTHDVMYPNIEVELQASGCRIAGDVKQTIYLRSNDLSAYWNISYERSGDNYIQLLMRLNESPRNSKYLALRFAHKLKVLEIGVFTGRQLMFGGYIAGGLTIAPTIVKILTSLGIIHLP